ncbi:MAG: glycerol-3-phosphatase [Rhizobiales bacterium 63-7]|nr:MAG: glycerol-3-phosphatase [Rhizobiales bacterium 63-7]
MPHSHRPLFLRPHQAFLFDMDGTLLNSIAVVERIWADWAVAHGLEPEVFLKTVHGIRAADVIADLALPGVDPQKEAAELLRLEMEDVTGIVAVPGAVEFLHRLPAERWAIVTSAPRALAHRRMKAAGIPFPDIMVTGEEVANGKPSPEGYLLGAKRLGVDPRQCVVFEDAVAGILAGEGAGAEVCVITATHSSVYDTPHFSLASYDTLAASVDGDGLLRLSHR